MPARLGSLAQVLKWMPQSRRACENLACPKNLYHTALPGAAKEPEEPLSFAGGSEALDCSKRRLALTASEGECPCAAVIRPGPWP